MAHLREWQETALERFLNSQKPNFLAVATPGAGKTTWALTVASRMLDARQVDRVIVVVPSDALRLQWSDHNGAGVHLRPYATGTPVDKVGYHGIVTTYQALSGMTSDVIRTAIGDGYMSRTLVILDEIHHAEDDSSYGKALRFAFENAYRRLMLTGTPWRTSAREKMPFVEFDENNMLKVDYSYDYGRAVVDGVCRPIVFPAVNGQAKWSRDGEIYEASLTVDGSLSGTDDSDLARALLDASESGGWLRDVLERAHADLRSMRIEFPDAGGLVVARNKFHAQEIADVLESVTGRRAPVVVSSEDGGGRNDDARGAIERFRGGRDEWIIAVKMIAEGVDIPRLMVGVYATNVTTAMFFNQVVGRFVRVRPNENATSRLYVPPTDAMWALVHEVKKMLPQVLDEEAAGDSVPTERLPATRTSTFVGLGSASDGLGMIATEFGDVDGGLVTEWEETLELVGVPRHYAANLASSGDHPPSRPARVAVEEVPLHRREKDLRNKVTRLSNKVANSCYGSYREAKQVRHDLYRRYSKSVDSCSIAELEDAVAHLERCLATGARV